MRNRKKNEKRKQHYCESGSRDKVRGTFFAVDHPISNAWSYKFE